MNESQLIQALEPYIEELLAVVKRMDTLERQPGPPGKDADVDALIARMKADPLFRGQDGASPKLTDIVTSLKSDSDFVTACKAEAPDVDQLVEMLATVIVEKYVDVFKGQPGADAQPPTAEDVAAVLAEKHVDQLRGLPGLPGEAAAPLVPQDVADVLKGDADFVSAVKGEPGTPGTDADPDRVAQALAGDADFVAACQGAPGADAPAVDPAEVAAALKADTVFVASLVGAPGADAEPAAPGQPGERGADGAGLLAPMHVADKVYREGVTVMAYLGQYYRAKCDTAAMPGESDDWERIGTAGFRWRGLKPAVVKQGDIYIDDGSMFAVFDDVGKMVVQRPKAAPKLLSATITGNKLVLKMSNNDEITCDLPAPLNYDEQLLQVNAKTAELEELVRVQGEQLKHAGELINQLRQVVTDLGGDL